MNNYVVLCNNRIINIVKKEYEPKYPPTQNGYEIITKKVDDILKLKIGMMFDPTSNTFYIPDPYIEPPTEQELMQAELLLNQADILARQNEQDEVLAQLLLNQMGV